MRVAKLVSGRMSSENARVTKGELVRFQHCSLAAYYAAKLRNWRSAKGLQTGKGRYLPWTRYFNRCRIRFHL